MVITCRNQNIWLSVFIIHWPEYSYKIPYGQLWGWFHICIHHDSSHGTTARGHNSVTTRNTGSNPIPLPFGGPNMSQLCENPQGKPWFLGWFFILGWKDRIFIEESEWIKNTVAFSPGKNMRINGPLRFLLSRKMGFLLSKNRISPQRKHARHWQNRAINQ